eukprot:CAMPEP_0183299302 /NCGR_PEP_ID=MMETSP0160_2-20130417/6075_1 /TAXON_ID=2839 ORGANISM="Odontella Sinensis, Strain Grunow 1884" /NCGR_SAMPLE_ID=MMETSP0160_2 /ASSEMBLY_ACC=CAM_ASM_000250 /LENGTH=95 /DNA_ID=CAMNT_0025461519 /DNA_START=157 /DNA_END=441 /DNA_ORIENTATION=+
MRVRADWGGRTPDAEILVQQLTGRGPGRVGSAMLAQDPLELDDDSSNRQTAAPEGPQWWLECACERIGAGGRWMRRYWSNNQQAGGLAASEVRCW